MTNLDLKPAQRALIDQFSALARENFAPRAAYYDQTATFPSEDFEDLFKAGLNAPTVPKEYGGLGLGPQRGDVFTLWMITKHIASADLSLARCWEGHANSLVLLDGIANESQKALWFEGVVQRGDKWVAWSGEPQSRAPGEVLKYGTNVKRVEDGFLIDGTKVFSTSATGAQWAILLVSLDGPGGDIPWRGRGGLRIRNRVCWFAKKRRRSVRPAPHRGNVYQCRDCSPLATPRRADVGDRPARGSSGGRKPRASRDRTSGRRYREAVHSGLRSALSEPAKLFGADLSGSVLLCAS
jgi:hypothetical protein